MQARRDGGSSEGRFEDGGRAGRSRVGQRDRDRLIGSVGFAGALILALIACSSENGAPAAGAEVLATVQQPVPVATFETAAASDAALGGAVSLAKTSAGVSTVVRAGKLEDAAGVALIYGAMTGPNGENVVVVRHCSGAGGTDCVSAVQEATADGGDVTWRNSTGPVPVRTVRMPLQLRIIDEASPDTAPVLGSRAAALTVSEAKDVATNGVSKQTDPARKLRVLSAFNQYMTFDGPNFNEILASIKKGGFPDATARYGVKAPALDAELKTLGPRDAVMLLAHGDESKSRGRVVGMSVNADSWGAEHYSESKMIAQLAMNPTGGPGIIFLAGCKTAEMVDALDSQSRIVLGFEGKIEPGLGAKVLKQLFDALGEGKTLKEGLDAVNATIGQRGLSLKANKSANLGIKLVDIGAAGTCDAGLAGSFGGMLAVTTGTAKVPVGMQQTIACGAFVTTLGDDVSGVCKGCYLQTMFGARKLAGCATGTKASLTMFDAGAFITMDLMLVTQAQLSVSVTGDDSDAKSFTRSGSLARCP
jgi:hypothetical protein